MTVGLLGTAIPESEGGSGNGSTAHRGIEQPDGGTNHVYKIAAAKVKFDPLTIERYVDGSPEDKRFRDWFRAVFQLNSATQGGSSARNGKGRGTKPAPNARRCYPRPPKPTGRALPASPSTLNASRRCLPS